MPVRPTNKSSSGEPAKRRADLGVDEEVLNIGLKAGEFLSVKKQQDNLGKTLEKHKVVIKDFMESDNPNILVNGKHKEIYAPMGDGTSEVFIQLQAKESVKVVDNIIPILRAKLGDKVETFIHKVEVLQTGTLESLYKMGLIDDKDILDLTSTTESKSLIVKLNKK